MKQFKYKEYLVNLYTDVTEYAIEAYDMPENATVHEDDAKEVHGHASIEDKEIFLYVPDMAPVIEIQRVIAHEIGHFIEFNHERKPTLITIDYSVKQIEKWEKINEARADFFESFFLDVVKISGLVQVSITRMK